MAALSITYAAEFAELLMWSVRQWTELEVVMVAVERVLDYTDLPSEAWEASPGKIPPGTHAITDGRSGNNMRLPKEWPEQGRLEFEDVWLVYEARSRGAMKATGGQKKEAGGSGKLLLSNKEVSAKAALRGVTFSASPGERIAVVGRTGAGKSSLVSALFRLVELAQGRIYIDGVDIAGVPLSRLRRSLAVVPQEPVLFSGSLRNNFDPRGDRPDQEIWDALEAVALKETVAAKGKKLEEEIGGGGGTLSLGERQLLCVARALLQDAKVTVLDEASSAVDSESERAIYRALLWRPGMMNRSSSRGVFGSSGQLSRPGSVQSLATLGESEAGRMTPRLQEGAGVNRFYAGTVLYIAHKLSTVLQCDRVIVLDHGRIVEMDSPAVLMAREGSKFAAMVDTMG
jgi:ABC-type multidrug transport system fused ATPase/permease subunit